MYKEEKELWVKFACAALSGCASDVAGRYLDMYAEADEIAEEDVIEDDCRFAYAYADRMLDLFKEKFEGC